MFLDRDYSKNNPLTSTYEYSSYGLPDKIIPYGGTTLQFMIVGETIVTYVEAAIKYRCK